MDKIKTIENLAFKYPIDNIENFLIILKYSEISEIEKILKNLSANKITKFYYLLYYHHYNLNQIPENYKHYY